MTDESRGVHMITITPESLVKALGYNNGKFVGIYYDFVNDVVHVKIKSEQTAKE